MVCYLHLQTLHEKKHAAQVTYMYKQDIYEKAWELMTHIEAVLLHFF